MNTDQWKRVRKVLEETLDHAPEQRGGFLDQACAGEPDIRREVESLLTHEDDSLAGESRVAPESVPERIGRYRVTAQIGVGGMGVVYAAEQQEPKRRVALKVSRGGPFVDEQSLRMFKREVESLVRLKHPSIADIYESGQTENGEHFFAMELIEGPTLDRFLRSRGSVLTAEEQEMRLKLAKRMADVVHYAHQRGVIHRDLKPSNIIITDEAHSEDSSSPGARVPGLKILDFGLARLTDSDVAATCTADVGVIKGTLAYMSPEQARGRPDEIDIRSDIYSLGVILYEMLTGKRPYDVKDVSVAEALRVICDQPPTPLRQHWNGVGDLDPDLETIVGKALEKDVDRRYSSAAALAEDIERYLALQPIMARPPSTVYLVRKFARRNRPVVIAAVAVAIALVVGATLTGVAAVRATRAERAAVAALAAAERDARTATEVTDFLVRTFEINDPGESRGTMVTAREMLDTSVERVRTELTDQPLVQARLLHISGRVYLGLGLYVPASELLESAREIRGRELGDDHPDTAEALTELGIAYDKLGRFDDAESILRQAVEIYDAEVGPDDLATARALQHLAHVLHNQGTLDEAEALYRRALSIREQRLPSDAIEVAMSLNDLGYNLSAQNRLDEAETLLQRSLTIFEGADDHGARFPIESLAWVRWNQGRIAEAIELQLRALVIAEHVLGSDHLRVATSLESLGTFQRAGGQPEEARAAVGRALAIREAGFGPNSVPVAQTLGTLATIHIEQTQYVEAEGLLLRALEIAKEQLGSDHVGTAWLQTVLGSAYLGEERFAEAEAMLKQALATREALLGPDHVFVAFGMNVLGEVYIARGDYALAESTLLRAVAIAEGQLDPENQRLAALRKSLEDAQTRGKAAGRAANLD